jgi:hypothetical protein
MSGQTWAMGKALSELMARHGQEMVSPEAVALSPPTSAPMLLSGLASTLDTDVERVQFAPFAFGDPLPGDIPLHWDHQPIVAGRIEQLGYTAERGELTIRAYVDHPAAVRCNAWSVSGDVLEFSLHDTDKPSFFSRVEKIRLREISLVPNPINNKARVLKRELPSSMSKFVAGTLKQYDLLIAGVGLIQKQVQLIGEINR